LRRQIDLRQIEFDEGQLTRQAFGVFGYSYARATTGS
jgi:hypothetical protein